MKDSLNTLKELASSVRNATKEGENSAERIGRLFEGILEYIKTPESIENYFELKQDGNGLDYIYTKYNIASAGALSMYASDKINIPSIYDGLPIDNDTIYWHEVDGSKVLKAKGGGGEAGSVQWDNISGKPSWIEDTKPSYSWSDITGEKPFYTKEEIASKYVTINTEQEITALKHFTAGLSVGESKKKIYEENGVLYIDADVAVTGAMTFYATAGRTVSTIMDAVTVDGITIKKENNVLKAVSGAGSSFDENAMWSALSGSSDNQINKSHLTTALDGYATQNWVIENYATKSELSVVSNKLNDFLEGSDTDTIINKWKELEAFLSGMAETDNLAEILKTKADRSYVDSTFVTLATKQTITGEKTFSSVLNTAAIKASGAITAPSLAASDWVTIAGIKLRKLEDGALILEGNLALTGALTMYATGAQGFDTIYDGLPIDNDTIYWSEVEGSKVLKAKEGSGSSFDKSAMWAALEGTTTEQINKTHLTTALNGYATESWVTSKNYLTSVSIATISDLHANWDALLKAAPSAYVTRWPTISEVTGRKNLIIKLNGGSTEGTNLFTYNVTGEKTINITPAGIGAAASSHNHSWSNITSGKPTTLAGYGITDAPTKTGSGASGTWGINISGNASNADKIDNAHNGDLTARYLNTISNTSDLSSFKYNGISAWSTNSSNRPADYGVLFQFSSVGDPSPGTNGHWVNQIAYGTNARLYTRQRINAADWTTWKTIAFLDDNVASATKLRTPRQLWGNDFDGTAPVNGRIYASNGIYLPYGRDINNEYGNVLRTNYDSNTGGDYFELTAIGANKRKVSLIGLNYGELRWEGSRFVLGAYGGGWYMDNSDWIKSQNNKGIYTGGNILSGGGCTFYGSDIRYKYIVQHVQLLALNKIAEAPSFVYRWNRPNMNQNRLNLGGSAQYTQTILPWAVEDNDNFLSMDYATVAYTFAVHTARHLQNYETRTDKKIKKLENRVKYLEKQLKKLGYEEVRTLDDSGI